MGKTRKIYVHPGELVHIHVVHEAFDKTARGWSDQLHPQAALIKVHSALEISEATGMMRFVPWETRARTKGGDDG